MCLAVVRVCVSRVFSNPVTYVRMYANNLTTIQYMVQSNYVHLHFIMHVSGWLHGKAAVCHAV